MIYSGTFDAEGTYYGAPGGKTYIIPGLSDLSGYATPEEVTQDFSDADFVLTGGHHDLVTVNGDFDGNGEAKYLLWMTKKNEIGVVRITQPRSKWYLKTDLGDLIGEDKDGWGAGWNYHNQVYFA